jgi:hypothetical protein
MAPVRPTPALQCTNTVPSLSRTISTNRSTSASLGNCPSVMGMWTTSMPSDSMKGSSSEVAPARRSTWVTTPALARAR